MFPGVQSRVHLDRILMRQHWAEVLGGPGSGASVRLSWQKWGWPLASSHGTLQNEAPCRPTVA